MALQYLTVQDVLWINLQVTGRPQEFRYADLEEATFYQYAYGESSSLIPQAARFLSGFVKKKPLAAGNEATALVACLAFLKVNGYELRSEDSYAWFASVLKGTHSAQEAIEKDFYEAPRDHHVEIREAISEVMADQKDAVAKLSEALA
jgi:prophage maintenance system killer protein